MAQDDQSIISPGVSVNGRLSGDQEVCVQGRIDGTIALNNHLFIDEGGQVTAEVDAETLTVRGTLNGDVVVRQLVTLAAGCAVTGNIRSPRIVIEEGARFKGNIDMDVELAEE